MDGCDQIVGVGEMLVHESEDHVAAFRAIVGIHCDFPEEIFYLGILHGYCPEAVPEVVEGVDGVGTFLGVLIIYDDKGPSEFESLREEFAEESGREVEHVGSGDMWHTVDNPYVFAEDKPVSADYLAACGIPYDHLAARHRLHRVELVDVAFEACAASGVSESYLAQTADFAHCVWRVEGVDHIYFIVTFVGAGEQTVGSKFGLDQRTVYFVNNLFQSNFLVKTGDNGQWPVDEQ